MKKILIGIGVVLIISIASILWYRSVFVPKEEKITVDSQVILAKLQSEGFLISQTYVFNQKVDIEKSSGSEWKDIFWGQRITASGNMKVSSGVDLRKLGDKNIEVSHSKITVYLPSIEVQSIELAGDLLVINKQGLFKKVFDSDDGYNMAYARLREEAKKAAQAQELKVEAEENAKREIEKLLRFVEGGKKVKVEFLIHSI